MRNILKLMLIALLLVSCGGKQSQEKSDAKSEASSKSQTLTKQLEKKKYPLEHGIIYQKVSAAGFETKPVIYFDKWGDWQATETSMNMEMMGVKAGIHSINIVKGDEHWDINLEEKSGKHYKLTVKINEFGVDVNTLTESMKKEMNIKELGEETYLGYKCKKLKIKNDKMKMNMVYLTYGNLMMKMEGEAMGIKTKMEVTKLETSAPPAEKFTVPKGITIKDE
jgi:autonomous glycyl radical cofactor GrcA